LALASFIGIISILAVNQTWERKLKITSYAKLFWSFFIVPILLQISWLIYALIVTAIPSFTNSDSQ
jgi:hypothetical protein